MFGIILLGESCSGKSTIGKTVQNRLATNHDINVRYISTGDIARQITQDDRLNKGMMADEESMRSAIINKVREEDTTFILDGCPRFYEQYIWMNSVFDNIRFIYLYIDVPYWQIVERARKRGRSDDDAIITKHNYFYNNTLPMIERIYRDGEEIYIHHNPDNTDTIKLADDIIKTIVKVESEEDENSRF